MTQYAILTIYDEWEESIQFFNTKRDLNKAVKEFEKSPQYSQYERYIVKVIGMINYK